MGTGYTQDHRTSGGDGQGLRWGTSYSKRRRNKARKFRAAGAVVAAAAGAAGAGDSQANEQVFGDQTNVCRGSRTARKLSGDEACRPVAGAEPVTSGLASADRIHPIMQSYFYFCV